MSSVDVVVETKISRTPRARQLEGMFDVPPEEKSRLEWHLELPIEERDWNVGLIVGPSGSGKTVVARHLWGDLVDQSYQWNGAAVVDDFDKRFSMQDVASVCQTVGFNTIPAWLRPFRVLSNGEQFRASLARQLLEGGDLVVVDEFTSVVDRQVAQIGAHAVQKYIRRNKRRFVGVSCHYDIIDWLQPDWLYDMGARRFDWRCLQRRPELDITISPVPYSAWSLFAPFHYMSAHLHKSARLFGLFVGDRIASVGAFLYRPHTGRGTPIVGLSRLVTLPDFQGLGLAFVLTDRIASLYKSVGYRVHCYPAHPSLIRAYDRSSVWALCKQPGHFKPAPSATACMQGKVGGRPCAMFSYEGPAGDPEEARRVFSYWPGYLGLGNASN